MTNNRSLLLLTSFLAVLFVNEAGAQATTQLSDKPKVIQTMESMYVALANDDLGLFHNIAAPDFYAFDVGKRFDGDALMQVIKSLHAAGNVYVWHMIDPEVQIWGDTASVTYINQGSIQDASGKKDVTWLESAVLRKDKGIWRIHFFHSSRVPT